MKINTKGYHPRKTNCFEIRIFHNSSPKRQTALEDSLTIINSQRKEKKLDEIKSYNTKTLCETRWVTIGISNIFCIPCAFTLCRNRCQTMYDRFINVSQMYIVLYAVLPILFRIEFSYCTIWFHQASFLTWMVPFCVNLHFSGYLRSLSLLLQGPTLNIIKAHEQINLVKT
jgi:hypothetical protein